ncbi:major facilitator superfamily domain-containing protein [Pisolithus croceorrhizus]|nr:major facilitator superfamily domain-containing protein [Pisolithus croceorrhizus]
MSDTEQGHPPARPALQDYERDPGDKPPFVLTFAEVKLLGIAGVGFFLDAYDLFIINPVSTMLQYRLYGGKSLPNNLQGLLKAAANIGSVIGQFLFGYFADALGRKALYGKELMLIIFATIMCISCPTNDLSPDNCLIWLTVFRIILGIGVGGDYPMSASVTSDRAVIRKRGTLLAYIFANQGWGSFMGSLATIIVLACYKHVMNDEGETSKVDGVWRIVIGLSLIPAFGTLYQRLTLPEAERYKRAKNDTLVETDEVKDFKDGVKVSSLNEPEEEVHVDIQRKAHFREFLEYFSEWRHAKILIGTCTCWFLLDIAFYGINLNQNVVLQQIGYAGTTGTPWEKLFKVSTGNIIITALGFVPGYYVSVLTIEKLGRKVIQFQGFLMTALFLGILAGKFTSLNNASFIVCFALLQCYPAEVFPTKYRATAHGMSAACGKAGAIISALVFNTLTSSIGTPAVLWIFFGCSLVGACFTLLLPEVAGRDPDAILAEEIREKRLQQRH